MYGTEKKHKRKVRRADVCAAVRYVNDGWWTWG